MAKALNSAVAVAAAVVTALALFWFITAVYAGKAEAAGTESGGAAQGSVRTLVSSGTMKVSGRYIISKDSVIPEGATLYVKKGGTLYILNGAELALGGTLKVASGGSVYVQGELTAEESGKISCTGKMKIQRAGYVTLGGTLAVNKGGKVTGLGTLEVVNEFSDITCKGSVTAKIKAPEPVEKDGVTYVGGVLIVNRKYDLPKDYGSGLNGAAYSAYTKMKKASGYDMEIVSGYRSYEKQSKTFAYWVSVDGYETASRYSAQPGHSEHQTGLAMDITSLNQSYADTPEGKWLAENCWKYGFILRYPADSEDITGYIYEPWHIRYLGTSTAKLVHDSGLTLEEFLGVD